MSSSPEAHRCHACRQAVLPFQFTMAFQPIVDVRNRSIYAYETLVRGVDGSGAASVLAMVHDDNRYAFDQACRVKSVELAARLDVRCSLSINFLPNAVYEPAACIQATLRAAEQANFPTERIVFEITESERVVDKDHLKRIIQEYRRQGFRTAIDDFGAGYSGLNLLTEFQPEIIKLDMDLLRGIHKDPVRQAIVQGIVGICHSLQIEVIAEGIEEVEELSYLSGIGINLFQGYLFARPSIEVLPEVHWPDADRIVSPTASVPVASRN